MNRLKNAKKKNTAKIFKNRYASIYDIESELIRTVKIDYNKQICSLAKTYENGFIKLLKLERGAHKAMSVLMFVPFFAMLFPMHFCAFNALGPLDKHFKIFKRKLLNT